MSHEWYRRHTWAESDQAEFFARLHRSRSNFQKSQYARIQAWELHRAHGALMAGEALKLLDMIVESWMVDVGSAEVHLQRAECLRDLGREQEAILAYRLTFSAQRQVPGLITTAHLDFAWWIAVSGRNELFDEALGVLAEFASKGGVSFPAHRYLEAGARALICHARGQSDDARAHARRALHAAALEDSGLRYHPTVGLVQESDTAARTLLTAIAAS